MKSDPMLQKFYAVSGYGNHSREKMRCTAQSFRATNAAELWITIFGCGSKCPLQDVIVDCDVQ